MHRFALPLLAVVFAVLVGALLVVSGCSDKKGTTPAPREKEWTSLVDGKRAMGLLQQFAEVGGFSHSRAHRKNLDRARELIEQQLEQAGVTDLSNSNSWPQPIPDKAGTQLRRVTMKNIVGAVPGKRKEVIAIACHYDTKIFDFQFVGANDGCSGVALTLELARHVVERAKKGELEFTYWFVFFDGEEAIFNWSHQQNGVPDNCYGSRRMASNREKYPIETLILLDMVGDKDLRLNYEARSNSALRRLFHERSEDFFGVDLFGTTKEILDDHIPFVEAGMNRVIDLIDFEYGPANSWWHTEEDTVDKCSAESLDRVGSLVLHALPAVEDWLAKEID